MTAQAPLNSFPGDEVRLEVPTDILCSYFYFSGVDMGAVRSWGTRIIGDSGAFSAFTSGDPVDREDFHAWADRWRDDLFWVASLDVIGDPEGTRANWQAAQRDGLNLVPTVHYGASPDDLAWYVEQGVDFLGLGGMVPYSGEPDRLMRWLIPMFKWARDHAPHVRFHGWGISHPRLVDRLPWWSTDSSGFSSVFRFGTLRLWLPHRSRFVSVEMNGHDARRHAKVLREVYGVSDWRTVSVSTPRNRREVGRVAYRSVQLYAAWLQSRQRVTPPASLVPALEREAELFAPATSAGSSDSSGPLQVGAPAGTSSTLPLSPNPAMRATDMAVVETGPLQTSAVGAQDRVMDPGGGCSPPVAGGRGPLQSNVLGFPGTAQNMAIHPENSLSIPSVRGPRSVGAVGWPDSQVMKAVDPSDAGAGLSPSTALPVGQNDRTDLKETS